MCIFHAAAFNVILFRRASIVRGNFTIDIDWIADSVLDETCSPAQLRCALDAYATMCSDIGGVDPDPSFSAWAEDSLLPNGVAINPQAAAQCVMDYQRSAVFLRGVYAAICSLKRYFAPNPIEIFYAGCGPFATLLLPLLGKFGPDDLNISLLDVHQESLASVELLLEYFGFMPFAVTTIAADACEYQHNEPLHLVIAETMQKSLEQEPQFAVTANLASQLVARGVFIPQCIDVSLQLAELEQEAVDYSRVQTLKPTVRAGGPKRYPLTQLCRLSADGAASQLQAAQPNLRTGELELEPVVVDIPSLDQTSGLSPALFTRIVVYGQHCLEDYQAEITLPLRCYELEPLTGGARYRVSYQLGSYPRFNYEPMPRGLSASEREVVQG